MINAYYCHKITQSLYSKHGSLPKTDPHIKNKWTATEAGTTSSFCSPLDCASHIIGHIIDTLWDIAQASPSRALCVWIIHVNCHKRHLSHWQQCTSKPSNNMFFLVSRAISGPAALLAKALIKANRVDLLHVACQQQCPLTWTGKPHWGLISWHNVTHILKLT